MNLTGAWTCKAKFIGNIGKVVVFQDRCTANTTMEGVSFTVSGNVVTFTGTQWKNLNATVNPPANKVQSIFLECTKISGNKNANRITFLLMPNLGSNHCMGAF